MKRYYANKRENDRTVADMKDSMGVVGSVKYRIEVAIENGLDQDIPYRACTPLIGDQIKPFIY